MRYTADTLALIKARNPGVDFVWIMGADNLRDFHRWQHWRQIVMTFPIAVIDRPGSTLSFLSSMMAKTFDYARVDETDAPRLAQDAGACLDLHPRTALVALLVHRHSQRLQALNAHRLASRSSTKRSESLKLSVRLCISNGVLRILAGLWLFLSERKDTENSTSEEGEMSCLRRPG